MITKIILKYYYYDPSVKGLSNWEFPLPPKTDPSCHKTRPQYNEAVNELINAETLT